MLRYTILLILVFINININAQELPPIEAFTPDVYEADNQNWAIAQTEDNLIYVANNIGLLEFNGETWQLYNSPSGKMRSVKVIDSLVYSGSYREFGYWKKEQDGAMRYTSLSKKLDVDFLEDEEFWNIIAIDHYILFQSLKRIYIYNKKENTYSVINSDTSIYKIFKINRSIYFQEVKQGLFKIEQGKPQLVSNNDILKNNYLVNIYEKGDDILIQTEENGFFILTPNKELSQWDIPANKRIASLSVYRSKKTNNGYMLGTRSNGIFHLTSDGNIDYSINFSNGLLSNSIHDIFEDSENNVWLALENGINCINVESPFLFFHDKEGKIGTTYASAIHNNYLYLGTNQGLFYKNLDSNNFKFTFVEGTEGPVWSLINHNDVLFCGHNFGTFIIENGRVKQKIDAEGTWNIIKIPNKESLLLQGNYDGLSILEKTNGIWNLKHKIEGFNISSKFFEIQKDQVFVSHEYKGVFRLKLNDNLTKVLETVQDTSVNKGIYSSLVKYNNKILYTYKDGIYEYADNLNKFVKDTLVSHLFEEKEFTSGKLISDKKNDILWGFSKKKLNYITTSGLSTSPIITSIPFSESLPHGLTGSENISHLYNQNYLIGTSDGYTIIDLNKVKQKTYTIAINTINVTDQESEIHLNASKHELGSFSNSMNNVEFKYSVTEFNKYLDTEYQYKLEGFYKDWSTWSSESNILFKNLPYGDYQFKVRAKVGNAPTVNTGIYHFTIERPWYLSNNMIAVYVVAAILLILIVHNIYKRYYRKQREKLIKKNEREIELKDLENKQQLMRFKNEKLKQDIDSKNRELGISTMNLIKKNDFLNSIKLELLNIENNDRIKRIVKIIDQNLNNTDDWKLFEEAFNNADKDFLKKVKQIHPELTSNDLRLCAYLRLNLSSKEIAPLLNISHRSVEVKRYRLRKKMNLPHEASLTNYILEI